MDELAHSVGQDPLEFRRKLMAKHPKHLAVLNAVAEKIGWGKPAPQGVYRGLAQHMGYGSYVAGAAEISVTDGNKIKVHRIVAATDPGYAVNPAQIERQIAGSFVYGLSATVLRRVHRQGRPHRAVELRHLQFDADRRDAEGGIDHHAERRLLGRRRRADDLRRRAGRAECVLRGDRQTYPLGTAEGSKHHLCLNPKAAALAAAAPSFRIELMAALRLMTRRNVVRGIAAAAASFALPCPSHAQSAARIVVIGGGFGGATCARALRQIDGKLQVTLVEPNRTFTACPFSNEVIAGLRDIEAQQFGYDRIAADGVTVIAQAAVKIDPQTRIGRSRRRHVARLRPSGARARHRPALRRIARL